VTDLADELRQDLATIEDRFANDNEFSRDLYRALTNNTWHKEGSGGHVALSWGKAEELVNELRARVALDTVELEQTGGEGEVAETVRTELEALGWRSRPLNPSRHDDQHVSQGEEPPSKGTGERHAPVTRSDEWAEIAHAEADFDRAPPTTDEGPGRTPES